MCPSDRKVETTPARPTDLIPTSARPSGDTRSDYQSPEVFTVGTTVDLLRGVGGYYGDFFGRFNY